MFTRRQALTTLAGATGAAALAPMAALAAPATQTYPFRWDYLEMVSRDGWSWRGQPMDWRVKVTLELIHISNSHSSLPSLMPRLPLNVWMIKEVLAKRHSDVKMVGWYTGYTDAMIHPACRTAVRISELTSPRPRVSIIPGWGCGGYAHCETMCRKALQVDAASFIETRLPQWLAVARHLPSPPAVGAV